jgi:hypothetical protein
VSIGGDLTCHLGNGTNAVNITPGSVSVMGSVSILGGTGVDNVTLAVLDVHKKLTVNLGDSPSAQTLNVLNFVRVFQGLSLQGGNNSDTFDLTGLIVLGTTSITTLGGDDTVNLSDSFFNGSTTIDAGAGNDTVLLQSDLRSGATSFGTSLTILGGAGNDALFLGSDVVSALTFGGPTVFDGGPGTNTRTDSTAVVLSTNGSPIAGTNGW